MNDNLLEIRHQLLRLQGGSIFLKAIREGVESDFVETLNMIKSQAEDNFELMCSMIGEDLLIKIIDS